MASAWFHVVVDEGKAASTWASIGERVVVKRVTLHELGTGTKML